MSNLIYLAGPYSYSPDLAFEMHMQYAAHLMREGHLIFSPILHNHQLAKTHNLPTDFTFWKRHNEELLTHCEELWVIAEGLLWKNSVGVKNEIEFADKLHIPVSYIAYCSELSIMAKSTKLPLLRKGPAKKPAGP